MDGLLIASRERDRSPLRSVQLFPTRVSPTSGSPCNDAFMSNDASRTTRSALAWPVIAATSMAILFALLTTMAWVSPISLGISQLALPPIWPGMLGGAVGLFGMIATGRVLLTRPATVPILIAFALSVLAATLTPALVF